jgi:hypothetical protein
MAKLDDIIAPDPLGVPSISTNICIMTMKRLCTNSNYLILNTLQLHIHYPDHTFKTYISVMYDSRTVFEQSGEL